MIEGTMNVPAKRILDKVHHMESVLNGQNEAWQDIGLTLGWSEWQLGVGEAGADAKERKSGGKRDIRNKRLLDGALTMEELDKLSPEEITAYMEARK